MTLSLMLAWCTLLTIGVSDAKTHRIPNTYLIFLIALLFISTLTHTSQQELSTVILNKTVAFVVAFIFSLVLYLLKVMAPGDVKLIAVLGFFLGTGELFNYLYYVCLMTAFVGSMYWLLNRLYLVPNAEANMERKEQANGISFTGVAVAIQLTQLDLNRKIVTRKDLTYMPFAPILVMGLALHQYYS